MRNANQDQPQGPHCERGREEQEPSPTTQATVDVFPSTDPISLLSLAPYMIPAPQDPLLHQPLSRGHELTSSLPPFPFGNPRHLMNARRPTAGSSISMNLNEVEPQGQPPNPNRENREYFIRAIDEALDLITEMQNPEDSLSLDHH